jgi:hypothetical protein
MSNVLVAGSNPAAGAKEKPDLERGLVFLLDPCGASSGTLRQDSKSGARPKASSRGPASFGPTCTPFFSSRRRWRKTEVTEGRILPPEQSAPCGQQCVMLERAAIFTFPSYSSSLCIDRERRLRWTLSCHQAFKRIFHRLS